MVASLAPAYYHFIHFTTFTSPFVPAPERFDPNALVDNTVRYYISSSGPVALAPNDSMASLVSEIRLAAKAWNDVPSSALRVKFGGLVEAGTPQSTPAIDIIFDEVPPGLIALGGPTARSEMVVSEDGAYVPITRSVVILNQDLSSQPSSSEGFFLTMVHELGHALGLQHTFTSSVMSTSISRATTKAKPLGIDDVAGISLLYPAPGFAASTGVISGRVVLDDAGVSLASVVALSPQGAAVSALANPDGTYRIEGVPPGQYYVYAHPVPPPVYGEVSRGNLVLPLDPDGNPIPLGPYFETEFYPGVKTIDAALAVTVNAGEGVDNIDFYVRPRGVPDLYAVTTYSFPGNVAVRSAQVSLDSTRRFLVAYGFGLAANGAPAPGLRASVVGGSAYIPEQGGLAPYAPDPRFVQINLEFNPFSGTGPRHLLFSLNNDIYVLPSGLHLTQNGPPSIEAVAPAVDSNGRPAAAISGMNLSMESRFLFDGAQATILGTDAEGRILVRPPPAQGPHRATVVALNPDGQSSWFLNGFDSPIYDYEEVAEPASLALEPSELAPGSEAMLVIRGTNTHFAPGQTSIGFGSSDVVVRDFLVLDPTLILANVAVAPAAGEVSVSATVASGLEMVTQPAAIRVLPPDPGRLSMHSPARDVATGRPVAYAGKAAVIQVSGLPDQIAPETVSLTLNDAPATVESVATDQVQFMVPADVRPGPVVARLNVAGQQAAPILVEVALPPPAMLGVYTEAGAPAGAETPLHPGEMVQLRVADLGPVGEAIDPDRVQVSVGGIEHVVQQIIPADGQPEIRIVQFYLGLTVEPGDQVPLNLSLDGRPAETVFVPVAAGQ